jgi:hypothetical protein
VWWKLTRWPAVAARHSRQFLPDMRPRTTS